MTRVTPGADSWSIPVSVDPARILKGNPASRLNVGGRHLSGEFGEWEVTPGQFTLHHDGGDEVVFVLDGAGSLVSDDGTVTELKAGASFVVQDGFRGYWNITETLRKFYVKVR